MTGYPNSGWTYSSFDRRIVHSGRIRRAERILLSENLDALSNWKELYFSKVKEHSVYTTEKEDRHHVLRAESHTSASAIVYKNAFDMYDYEITVALEGHKRQGCSRTKEGDDYPLRFIVMIGYDPARALALERMEYAWGRNSTSSVHPSACSATPGHRVRLETVMRARIRKRP